MHPLRISLALFALAPLTGTPLFAQGSSGLFTKGLVVGDARDRWEAVVDLNGDGVKDLIGWYWEDSNWDRIRANATLLDGMGSVVSISTAVSPDLGYSFYDNAAGVGDFEGTGRVQMVVMFGYKVARFEVGEAGTISFLDSFSPTFGYSSSSQRHVVVADFTGDGVDDFILAGEYRMELWTAASGTPTYLGTQIWSNYFSKVSAGVADMTGDGQLDLVAVHHPTGLSYDATVSVYPVSAGVIGSPTSFDFYEGGAKHLAVGDVDGDGDDDAVVFVDSFYDRYAVLRQTAPGVLQFEPFDYGGPATHLVDVDGDGDLDGACCSGGGGGGGGTTQVTNTQASTFQVCLNDGSGRFDFSMPFTGLGAQHLAGAMDFDGDGDLDLLAGRAVLLNQQGVGMGYCSATPNSTGAPAALEATGSGSFAKNDLALVASQLPPGKFALGFFGFQQAQTPFYNGFKCIGGATKRLKGAGKASATGEFVVPLDLTQGSAAAIASGDLVAFQVWFRDKPAGGSFANLTGGVQVLFHP